MRDEDVALIVFLTICFLLAIAGIVRLVEQFNSTTLDYSNWQCTQAVVIEGKAECVKWEKK